MDTATIALVVLGLLSFSGSKTEAPPQSDTSGSGAAPPPVPGSAEDVLGAAAGGVGGVLGLLGSGGAGTGAAGAGAGAAATTGSTAATGGATSLAAGSTIAGATNGATAILGATGEVIGAISAGAAAGATAVIVGIIMAFIMAKRVADAMEIDKDWQGYLLGLNATGAGLHQFESMCVEATLKANGQTYTTAQIRDFRLDRVAAGQKLIFQGHRSVYRYVPLPAGVPGGMPPEVLRRFRAMAFEYLRLRGGHGYRMIRNWNVLPNPPANWGLSFHALNSEYEALMPGAGGLANIPHAAMGRTLAPRTVADSDQATNPLEIVSSAEHTEITGFRPGTTAIVLTEEEKKACALVAIIDALRVLKFDPRPAFEADRRFYAGETLRALSWDGKPPPGITHSGEYLELWPEVYGVRRYIYPARLKLKENGWMIDPEKSA